MSLRDEIALVIEEHADLVSDGPAEYHAPIAADRVLALLREGPAHDEAVERMRVPLARILSDALDPYFGAETMGSEAWRREALKELLAAAVWEE